MLNFINRILIYFFHLPPFDSPTNGKFRHKFMPYIWGFCVVWCVRCDWKLDDCCVDCGLIASWWPLYRTVVTICTAQWSLYVPHSAHYMYRTVVTICTAQWSLYVQPSAHYMYHTVVTICTAQWSLYVPHSGHCMYRTVVTICTAQWSLYVPHSGHYMYRTVVTICTTQWSLYVPPV